MFLSSFVSIIPCRYTDNRHLYDLSDQSSPSNGWGSQMQFPLQSFSSYSVKECESCFLQVICLGLGGQGRILLCLCCQVLTEIASSFQYLKLWLMIGLMHGFLPSWIRRFSCAATVCSPAWFWLPPFQDPTASQWSSVPESDLIASERPLHTTHVQALATLCLLDCTFSLHLCNLHPILLTLLCRSISSISNCRSF